MTRVNRHTRILAHLHTIAEDVPAVRSSRHAASLVVNGNIISIGVNSYKTDPMAVRYARNEKADCLHAEVSAIKNAAKRMPYRDFKKSSLYVVRAKSHYANKKKTPNGYWGDSKPCSGCMSAIRAFEIKHIVYSCEGIGDYAVQNLFY